MVLIEGMIVLAAAAGMLGWNVHAMMKMGVSKGSSSMMFARITCLTAVPHGNRNCCTVVQWPTSLLPSRRVFINIKVPPGIFPAYMPADLV